MPDFQQNPNHQSNTSVQGGPPNGFKGGPGGPPNGFKGGPGGPPNGFKGGPGGRPKAKKGTMKRLIKTLFEEYKGLLILEICAMILFALVSVAPSVYIERTPRTRRGPSSRSSTPKRWRGRRV